jgi:hypothetical protein
MAPRHRVTQHAARRKESTCRWPTLSFYHGLSIQREPFAVEYVQQLGRLAPGFFGTPIIARRGPHVGVPGHPLHRGNVGASIPEVAHEGAPEVMGRQMADSLFRSPLLRDGVGSRRGQPVTLNMATLADGQQQCTTRIATRRQPVGQGVRYVVDNVR